MLCPECGNEITAEMLEMDLCYECGLKITSYEKRKKEQERIRQAKERDRIAKEMQKKLEEAKRKEAKRWKEAHPDADGRYYEYRTIRIMDDNSGYTDVNQINHVLNEMGYDGWRLVSALSSEVGKVSNTSGYAGITSGTNATIDETILIFERVSKME